MAELSPAAQAVLTAASVAKDHAACPIAAALRAATDQVIPESEKTPWGSVMQAPKPLLHVRRDFLALATELETHQ